MTKRVFGIEKYKGLLLAGSFTVLANYIVRLSDSIIAGHLLGPAALAGVNLAGPILSIISFVCGMIATGMGTEYSIAMGRCEREKANRFFMQGIWSILMFGGIIALLIFCFSTQFLRFFGAAGECVAFARAYLDWIWPIAIVEGLLSVMISLGYADGDSKLCVIAYVVVFSGNFLISTIAVLLGFGTTGCAVGSVIADSLGVLVMCCHFVRKCNSVQFIRHFSFMDTYRICAASFGDAAAFLCDGALFLFLNKFVIVNFGSEILPVVGVVTAVWGLLEIFNGVGVAIQPIVSVYYGEGNVYSARAVMNRAMFHSMLEGIAVMLLALIFPSALVTLIGVNDVELSDRAIEAVRWMSIGFIPLAFAGLFNSYYMFVEKPALAGAVTFLSYLIMPIACVAICGFLGINGVWLGMGMGPLLGIALTSCIIISTAGYRLFPLLLDRNREAKLHVFNLQLTDAEIVEVSRKIGELPGVPMRAALMTEEVLMVVKERAKKRLLLGEVTIDLNNGVELTLRDDGEIFDITDADAQISSLRSFLVASMMQAQEGRLNLVTTGFNRNVFRF